MRNQTSFRLTTTVLPTDKWADHKAKVTQVINKVNESGEKYYPTFTEETVVLTNDDRTIMETVRAVCNNWVMEFVKRWLNDTEDATEWQNRALTWNPWTLCFITAWASDWIDKDDDITWTGDQTYTWDLISTGSATYRGALITEKWVQYPHFDNVSALEACTWAFGGMFAVVDSTGELYRYNAVTQERSVVESSTPTNPEMADDETIWTVRIATDAEFEAGTDTGSHGEYLVATPSQIQWVTPDNELHIVHVNEQSDRISSGSVSLTYTVPKAWFIRLWWKDYYKEDASHDPYWIVSISFSWASAVKMTETAPYVWWQVNMSWEHEDLVAVGAWELTITLTLNEAYPWTWDTRMKIVDYIYFW